jgi:integrase
VDRCLCAGVAVGDHLILFTDDLRAPLEGTTVLFRFQRTLRLDGIPRLRDHDLRHLHGALLLLGGVDIATVRDVLGHSSIALTADVYAGVMPALKQDAAARFEKLLQRPG